MSYVVPFRFYAIECTTTLQGPVYKFYKPYHACKETGWYISCQYDAFFGVEEKLTNILEDTT